MNKELKFIHITKCAGTFIEDIGKLNNIDWGRFHPEYGYWHDIFSSKPNSLKTKYDWFMVVRNPYDRILSEYYCEWGGIGKTDIIHTTQEFNQFLIYKIKTRILSGEHYSEQYKYLDDKVPVNIVKFENFNAEISELFKQYNIPIDITQFKRANTRESKNNDCRFTKKNFNKKLISVINEVYDLDFKKFNYRKIPSGILKMKKFNYYDTPATIKINSVF